jgi:hypothetical protein
MNLCKKWWGLSSNVEFPAEKQEQAMNFVMCADKRVHQWPTNMDSIFATKN